MDFFGGKFVWIFLVENFGGDVTMRDIQRTTKIELLSSWILIVVFRISIVAASSHMAVTHSF